jgi:hypothetical protein
MNVTWKHRLGHYDGDLQNPSLFQNFKPSCFRPGTVYEHVVLEKDVRDTRERNSKGKKLRNPPESKCGPG